MRKTKLPEYASLIEQLYAIPQWQRCDLVWHMNKETRDAFRNKYRPDPDGGTNNGFVPSYDFPVVDRDYLFGYPIEIDESVPDGEVRPVVPEIEVTKFGQYVPVSVELLLDTGAITLEQAKEMGYVERPRPKVSWRFRLRLRIEEARNRLGLKVGSAIAGRELEGDDSDEW